MLFRKKHPRACEYCQFSTSVSTDHVLCEKHGIRNESAACRGFRYDPCKRIPPKSTVFDPTQYSQDDFKL